MTIRISMKYDGNKEVYEFGDPFIENFIQEVKDSAWNPTQLQLMVETFVNFIDTATNSFMSNGHIGSAVQIFRQLRKVNNYVKEKEHAIFGENDPVLDELQKDLLDSRVLMSKSRFQPQWIRDLHTALTMPHKLCLGWFNEAGLQRLQDGGYSQNQRIEAHTIFAKILTLAIETLVQSEAYREAEENGHLYYNLEANPLEQEAESSSRHLKSVSPVGKSHSYFFSPMNENKKATDHVLETPKKKSEFREAGNGKR
jgi:hypothetical protein